MSIEIQVKPPALVVLKGTTEVVTAEVNRLGDEYVVLTFNYFVIKDEIVMLATLVAASELRKAQLMTMGKPGGRIN